jgi:hypothetical protein
MDPYSIEIFVPEGDPEGLRIVSLKNWTGIGCVFPRHAWKEARKRPEFSQTGIYILSGHDEADDIDLPGASELPVLYIGQTDELRNRINQHEKSKDFWDKCITFVSSNNFLNRAHVTWLEWALYQRAKSLNQCRLENNQAPQEPSLSEADKADMNAFLQQMFLVLPIVNIRAFEEPKAIHTQPETVMEGAPIERQDTIVIPAKKDGFTEVFLGENCWYAIRIGGGMLENIKYIAAYQSQPISAITHVAKVNHIEPYGDTGKYKVVFSEPAFEIKHIPYGDAPSGSMQGPRYTSKAKLDEATKLVDIL